MSTTNKKVVIIGGGITGITAAYYLQKEIDKKGLPIDFTLIEATHRLGGKIQTVNRGGFTIERGPDSFLARKLSMSKLIKEVGLDHQLVHNSTGKSYVLVKDALHRIPEGAVMGIPTQISPFVTTGLFSPVGKLRAAADFIIPRTKVEGDQALGTFFRRRLGDEVVENLIEPLLSGIYAGDIDRLSLKSTFPQFLHAEQKHRSLIVGMKKQKALQPKQTGEQKKKGMFLTLTTGLQSLVETIEDQLSPQSVLKGTRVEHIQKSAEGYTLTLNNGKTMQADSVIVTSPHQAAQSMLSHYEMFEPFRDMPSTSVATIAMAFPEEAIKQDIDGTGFVVSRNSDYTITACTWTHRKWPHTTPKGKVLLRCYVGKAGDEAIVDQSDDEIMRVVLDDLNKIMNIDTTPEFYIVTRWKEAMPQYTVGHQERLEVLNQQLESELAGLYLAGSSYEGLGLPDCIDQGEEAVKKVLKYLK
ncbi:protoporphyrinogen oxidase [Metabacillus iocasae]|uniref:Coproporphyrinogen III oxidase n=1 Tax=Priestia iocasae TaxID=2291674 RepID=A0ABS2QUJ7_9BACI|nr:oxygen-dependent protoporphyrinogen oxidase [Metabacillus iocasae]